MGKPRKPEVKLLFLDVDGVLISKDSVVASWKAKFPYPGKRLWPPYIAFLNDVTDRTGAKIVVSATCRLDGYDVAKKYLQDGGVTGEIIGRTPAIVTDNKLIRGVEIDAWLKMFRRSGNRVFSFVILDDSSDMRHLMPWLVRTRWELGLTQTSADAAVAILEERHDWEKEDGRKMEQGKPGRHSRLLLDGRPRRGRKKG